MGMLIDGKWNDGADRSMQAGAFRREKSELDRPISAEGIEGLRVNPDRYVLVASASCPWSHAVVLTSVLKQLDKRLPVQWAGGPRIEGYGLLPDGPITGDGGVRHVHQLYTGTNPTYTGRVTVPVLWDAEERTIVTNASAAIIDAINVAGPGPNLVPEDRATEITDLIRAIYDGLSNAVYRAGMAQRQDEYDEAVDLVFDTMDSLEDRMADRSFLFGEDLSLADVRLFASLVRFDTVYVTHFRCSRKRLVDYPNLWRFTRQIYQMAGIRETIDFDEIRFGYYVNDGDHNPHDIIGQQPEIDWDSREGL